MKNKSIICILASTIVALTAGIRAEACTNVIVTKGASADGSNLVSYAADSHWLYGELYFHPAADWKAGEKLRIYDWDSGRYLGEIDQVPHTYQTVGNMNEHQLIIAETTFGGRPELHDRKGGIDYGSLIYIALQRCRTAREAIKVMTDLANEHGYYSSGESFTIADKDEIWIMEMIGKGTVMKNGTNINKGVVWVAVKIPDGYVSCHANQSRIDRFPLRDPQNCLYSKDVISFARRKGYFNGEDADFSFCEAYCPLDFGAMRGCEARVWSAFNLVSNGWFTYEDETGRMVTKDAYSFIDYALGRNPKNRLPLYIEPAKKLTVKDVADIMRDHYEGTPLDMTADIGAGGNALPYRWRPMEFEYDEKTYVNERAIATQQTGFWFVGQARGAFPDILGGILWFGTDDAATSYVTPIYTNVNSVPECFAEGNGDLLTYSPTSSFWINNRISNACYKMYNQMAPFVRKKIDAFEREQVRKVRENDNAALDIYQEVVIKEQKKADKKGYLFDAKSETGKKFGKIRKQLTEFSVNTAQTQFQNWQKMEEELLIKFIDGNVKAQNPDGSFKHTEFSKHIPDGLTQPGYTEMWKEAVAESHGNMIEVKEK